MADPIDPASRPAAQVAPPGVPGVNALLTLAVGVVVVAALYLARDVLIPITLAVLLSFLLGPIVGLLRRIHFPNVLAVLFAVVLALSLIGALGGLIGVQVASLATDIPSYTTTIGRKVEAVRGATLGRLNELTRRVGRQMGPAPTADKAPTPGQATSPSEPKPIPVEVRQPSADPLQLARSVLEPLLAPFETTLIIFIVAVFILLQKEDLRDRLIRLFGSSDLHRTTVAMDDAGRRLSRYFLSQLGINTAFGVIIAVGLTIIGVPSPVLWGILSALLRFVPYVGPVIAAALPAALAAAVDPQWSMTAWTVGLFLVIESVTGQLVEPMIYGHSTGLSPVAVVVAAIFWTWLWGPVGLILSTPLTLCLVVLGRYVDRLEFLDVLLGDRPALTPIENFYQRMLADDPDEALEQAEMLLKDRSLSAYYDEVALKGLQLAANDAQRGVLGPDKLERIKHSIRALVHDLSDHDDRDPQPDKADGAATSSKAERAIPKPAAPEADAPERHRLAAGWQGAEPVLCLAGRGPLDEAASTILAELLGKHGLGARVLSHDAASRDNIAGLDPGGSAIVCVSYLEISGTPSHLHYLVRRLRQRLPNVPVLVGLWPAEAEAAEDKRLRAVIGADYYTSSLRDAVETCVRVSHEEASARDAAA